MKIEKRKALFIIKFAIAYCTSVTVQSKKLLLCGTSKWPIVTSQKFNFSFSLKVLNWHLFCLFFDYLYLFILDLQSLRFGRQVSIFMEKTQGIISTLPHSSQSLAHISNNFKLKYISTLSYLYHSYIK